MREPINFWVDGRKTKMESISVFNDEPLSLPEYLIGEPRKRKYIIDASVVFKWYYKKDEEDLDKAETLYDLIISNDGILLAPELLIYEILNILRLKEEIDDDVAGLIISEIYDTLIILGMDKDLLKNAFSYSRELDISFYDSVYISLSKKYEASLITADKKLFNSSKSLMQKTILLSELDLYQ